MFIEIGHHGIGGQNAWSLELIPSKGRANNICVWENEKIVGEVAEFETSGKFIWHCLEYHAVQK